MCPWPRIQAALTDEHALNVTYHYDRGEPRMSLKKAEGGAGAAARRPATASIATYCVEVCPTGVDIREGAEPRLHPMRPVHRRLRRRDGQDRPADPADRLRHRRQHQAPRAGAAAGLQAGPARARCSMPPSSRWSAAVMLFALTSRAATALAVIHDRNPLFVRTADGSIRNGYELRIANKATRGRDGSGSQRRGRRRRRGRDRRRAPRARPRASRSARTRRARCACC